MTCQKLAEDIVVGDVMRLWTETGAQRRVVDIKPYRGPLLPLLGEGTRSATFDSGGGATLVPGDSWWVD